MNQVPRRDLIGSARGICRPHDAGCSFEILALSSVHPLKFGRQGVRPASIAAGKHKTWAKSEIAIS